MREPLARLDTRRKEEARAPAHGLAFEERLGALLADESARLGDVYEATGETTGIIKQCKKGDYVHRRPSGRTSVAAHARIVWEAQEKQSYSLRAALDEIGEARRNRSAQVGVFVFSRAAAPEGVESLARHGGDLVVVWDAEDPASDLIVKAAYSLARGILAVLAKSGPTRRFSTAVVEIEHAARSVERQVGYLDDVRKWAETVKGHGEKIIERTSRMAEELRRDVERLDSQVASMRKERED